MAETSNGMGVGLIELPDDALDLLSHFTQSDNSQVSLVCSNNQDSYALRMAEILQLPTLDIPNRLSLLGCDLIIVGPRPEGLLEEVQEMMQGTRAQVISVAEAMQDMIGDAGSAQPLTQETLEAAEGLDIMAPGQSTPAPEDAAIEAPSAAKDDSEHEPAPSSELGFDAASLLGEDLQEEIGILLLDTSRGDLLNKILSIAIRATHTETGSIMLVDEGGKQLRIAVAKGLPPDIVASVRQPIGQGVAGGVFSSGKPRLVRGIVERTDGTERKLRPKLREAAIVPIFSEGRTIGTLSVNAEDSETHLTDRSLALLQRFAKEVSSAILKSLNLNRLKGDSRREALMRQVERIMALDEGLPHRMNAVADALRKAFDAELAQAFLADPLGRRLELTTARSAARVWVPMDKGFLGWIAREGSPRVLETWSKDDVGMATYFVPVLGDQPRGIMVLENVPLKDPGADRLLDTFGEIMDRVAEMIEVEKSLEAQELFSQLKGRVEEQGPRFSGLLPHERARSVLDFTRDLLGAETAVWQSSSSELKTVWARPDSSHAAALQSGMRPMVDRVAAWISEQGRGAGGLNLPGWDKQAPKGSGPFLGIRLPENMGTLILVFSPKEKGGTPTQVPAHILYECLAQVSGYLPKDLSQESNSRTAA